jgi:hypothetical protein
MSTVRNSVSRFVFTSINDTGGKFATAGTAGVVDTSGKLPPVSTTLAVILLPVTTTPGANKGKILDCCAYTLKCI